MLWWCHSNILLHRYHANVLLSSDSFERVRRKKLPNLRWREWMRIANATEKKATDIIHTITIKSFFFSHAVAIILKKTTVNTCWNNHKLTFLIFCLTSAHERSVHFDTSARDCCWVLSGNKIKYSLDFILFLFYTLLPSEQNEFYSAVIIIEMQEWKVDFFSQN